MTQSVKIPNNPQTPINNVPLQTTINPTGLFQYTQNDQYGNVIYYYTSYQNLLNGVTGTMSIGTYSLSFVNGLLMSF